jgi:hypothetical protein
VLAVVVASVGINQYKVEADLSKWGQMNPLFVTKLSPSRKNFRRRKFKVVRPRDIVIVDCLSYPSVTPSGCSEVKIWAGGFPSMLKFGRCIEF